MRKCRLPIGVDNFEKLRDENLYYVDKTLLIKELLDSWSEVTLFTRPRRFGKSLNMSMLKSFFEVGTNKSLFDGLAISKEAELCEKHMGKYPVISISLKGVEGRSFAEAKERFWNEISNEADRIYFLLEKDRIDPSDRQILLELKHGRGDLESSLKFLSRLFYRYYGQKVIILIDEYDVPLDKAYHYGYYNEMVQLIRVMFGSALKTNEFLQRAVLTGCLRVSKESIFTGLNNLKIYSIIDTKYDEWFGFTDSEVKEMLESYGLSEYYQTTKEWYDGYIFGQNSVYCPWDVINWCDQLMSEPNRMPQNFWANTSGNDMVRRFVAKANKPTQREIEELIAGESIRKKLRLDLTYNEIDKNIDNLWSVLFTTGYLTTRGSDGRGNYDLVIPNREVNEIFVNEIQEWFSDKINEDTAGSNLLCDAFASGDTGAIEGYLNKWLNASISIRDKQSKSPAENFYHGVLLGMLGTRGNDWDVRSNIESGDGYPDITVTRNEDSYGFIIELMKYAANVNALTESAERALKQIDEKNYEQRLLDEGITDIKKYGIAFFNKKCRVLVKDNRAKNFA
ncbi:MAG: ATP-binding protein [Oscillospiraceae bacterium]|nr:ATP-binding protein [Oscillospiraceae bacterium]